MFVRNESFQSFLRHYPVISILVAIHLVLFLWINFLPGGWLVLELGVGWNYAIEHGQYWRLITPILLHYGAGHVIFNSFSLILFGPALERMLGKFKFILAYFGAGILANIATFFLQGANYSHLGASGAIFGLFGIYLYMVLYRKDLIDAANSQVAMTILVIGLVMTFLNPGINILAHLFGLISGAALAPLILLRTKRFSHFQHVHDRDEISFNPNRWKKRRFNGNLLQKVLWIALGILILFGIIARFT
ncbi:rhomboid family intramembrane serine protease [Anaerobacillus sp. MEB173]|uniref:rhomboid family intramembrane serine protease n=1 Tax=Anaerobacillus sp. MEB173 TaxID=3383345 RepID=UPI003F918D56